MKRLKIVLIAAAALAALVLLAVALAFTSGVQTWAARRALAGQPGLKADIGRVAAGLSSAELRDIRIEQDGTVAVAKEITAVYSATDYLSGHRINVASLAVRGLEIDLSKSPAKTPPGPAAAVAPFAGVLNAIRLPGEVRLGRLDVDATVKLPAGRTVRFTLAGGGIAPGQLATIPWKVEFADALKGAPLATARAEGTLKLRTTADLRIDTLEVAANAAASGPNLPRDHVQVALKLEQPAAGTGERIAADIALVRGGAAEKLLSTRAAYAAGEPVISGTWSLTVRSEQFAGVLAAFGLPEVALAGEGSFSFNVETSAATASGALDGRISKLEKLGAELAAIGALQVRAAFDGGSSKGAAQLAKLDCDISTADGRRLVVVAAQQKLTFSFKDQRLTAERPGAELARVSLTGVPLAWAQPFVKPRVIAGGDIAGVFVVEAELDGSRVKARAVEPLTIRGATVREGDKLLVDRVTLSVSPTVDYTAARIVAEAQKLSVSTPDGDTLTGALSAEMVSGVKPSTAFAAQLQGRLAALVRPFVPADMGPLTVAVETKGRLEGESLQLSSLTTKIDRQDGAALLAVEALQPLAIDLGAQRVTAADASKPAARVRWGELPLAWAQPYVAQSMLAGQLAADTLEVTLAGADAVTIRALVPLTVRGASVALAGQQWLNGADLTTDLAATWKSGTLSANIQRLELRQGKATLLTAAFAGDVTPGASLRASGRGSVLADFAALAQQPALASQVPLARGAVTATFEGATADGVRGKLAIAGRDLVAREGAVPLGTMELSVEANLDANNAGEVKVPLVVTKDGRRSDLLVEGKVGLKPGAISFDGKISGAQIIVDDLQAYSALAAPPSALPTAASASPSARPSAPASPAARSPGAGAPVAATRDTTPVWAGFTGRIALDLATIKQGPGVTLANLRGALATRAERLTVENVSGQLNGNPFKVAAVLGFDVKQERPYALAASLDVPGFDVGAFLRKADPATPPALETVCTITSSLKGTGANLVDLAERTTGQFDFKGSKGVLRALNRKAETASLVAGVGGLLAQALGANQRITENLTATSELVGALRDIEFDAVALRVERTDKLALQLQSFELMSPTLHLTGSGTVDHQPGTPFAASPLELELRLAAKERLAVLMNQARLLDGAQDAQGYYTMHTPFVLRGTLGQPDSSALWAIILRTGANFLR